MLVSTLLITPLFLRFVKCERNERSKAGLIDGKLRPVIRYIFVVGSCDVMDVKNRWMKGFFLSFFGAFQTRRICYRRKDGIGRIKEVDQQNLS